MRKEILTDAHSTAELEWEENSGEWVIGKRQLGSAY